MNPVIPPEPGSPNPITPEQFFTWKDEYVAYNESINLTEEPEKVYFSKAQVDAILSNRPTFLTFVFACEGPESNYKGTGILMCGMQQKGLPLPDVDLYESVNGSYSGTTVDANRFFSATALFRERLAYYQTPANWGGVAYRNPDELAVLFADPATDRIVVYYGYGNSSSTAYGHYTIMIAGVQAQTELIPRDRTDTENQVLNNGTQCCQ